MKKQFHVGDLLSITSGLLLSGRGMEGFYEILNFMTGHDLLTHSLPAAADICKPVLLQQHPWLAKIDCTGVTEDNYEAFIEQVETKYGATHTVRTVE